MHELSIVLSIIDIAEGEAVKNNASSIQAIDLEIGCLSSVEINAFDFAWQQAIKSSMLEKAIVNIERTKGEARCLECNNDFTLDHFFDACNICGSHFITILKGKELRIKSLIINQ